MAKTKKKDNKPGFWGKVGNIAKGTGKHALKIITRTDHKGNISGVGKGSNQISKEEIAKAKAEREAGTSSYQKAVKEREAKNNPKPKPKPKKKKRGLMTKFEKKQADRQKRTARAKAWRENRAKNVSNEKNTGPTKLVKGKDGKVRRVKA